MLVNVNNIVKRGYKLSDCVLYNGNKYKIVAIDFVHDYKDSKTFLLNGHHEGYSNINLEGDDLSSFVLYESDEVLDKEYSLWVSYNQISKVENEVKNDNKKYEYYPGDFVNINDNINDNKKSIKKLLKIKENMSCSGLICEACPLNLSNDGCAVDLVREDAKERLDAIIEMYKRHNYTRDDE